MSVPRFRVGDRVRSICYTPTIRPGMVGTIQASADPPPNLYVVRFDELPEVELIPEHCLELIGP